MSLLASIKGAFIEEVPDAAGAKVKAPTTPPVTAATHPWVASGAINSAHVSAPPPVVEPDPVALQKLEAKLQASVPPVYQAFLEQYNSLKEVIPDETTLFRAALKSSHASIDQLIQAFDQLLAVTESARGDFNSGFDAKRTATLAAAQKQIEATQQLIASRQSQLKAIEDEITSLQSTLTNSSTQLQTETARFESIRQGFEAALAQVVGRLNAQKTHLTQVRI